jgi:hypothetical protein
MPHKKVYKAKKLPKRKQRNKPPAMLVKGKKRPKSKNKHRKVKKK